MWMVICKKMEMSKVQMQDGIKETIFYNMHFLYHITSKPNKEINCVMASLWTRNKFKIKFTMYHTMKIHNFVSIGFGLIVCTHTFGVCDQFGPIRTNISLLTPDYLKSITNNITEYYRQI